MEVEAARMLLLLLACLSALAGAQQIATLNLKEGAVCSQAGGKRWTCAKLRVCRSAQQLLRRRQRPEVCSLGGQLSLDTVVCCEPQNASTAAPTPLSGQGTAAGAKSARMCKEYAKAVFTDLFGQKINNCANVEPLITKGKNSEPREYPHMALIGYGDKPKVEWLCGGSLISERYVLSAAHCSDAGGELGVAKWVRLGEYNVKSQLDDSTGLSQPDDYRIAERINHRGYVAKRPYDDIALYRLERNVRFNEFVRPACLHTSRTFAKTYAIATGWGRTEWGGQQSDILQKGNLTITDSQKCRNEWKTLMFVQYNSNEGVRDASQMCAGDVDNGIDTCQGDSGGPLQLRLRDPYCMYSVIGVTSLGSRCGGNTPGLYSRVSYYVPWIESVVWP